MGSWFRGLKVAAILTAVIWFIEIVNGFLGHALNDFGIYPRELRALPGVLFWVFLHGSFQHLVMNTMPLIVMGSFVALKGTLRFFIVTLIITILGGMGVWCFCREAYHVGASGLVFGYFGYLVALGIYERSLQTLFIASLIIFYYGGMIFGILPGEKFISWEAHLFGLFAGVLAARYFAMRYLKENVL